MTTMSTTSTPDPDHDAAAHRPRDLGTRSGSPTSRSCSSPTPDGQDGTARSPILVLSAVLGLVSVACAVVAWRSGNRLAIRINAAALLLNALHLVAGVLRRHRCLDQGRGGRLGGPDRRRPGADPAPRAHAVHGHRLTLPEPSGRPPDRALPGVGGRPGSRGATRRRITGTAAYFRHVGVERVPPRALAGRPAQHQLPRLGAPGRPGRAGRAAQAQGLRHGRQADVRPDQRASRAPAVPRLRDPGRRAVRSRSSTVLSTRRPPSWTPRSSRSCTSRPTRPSTPMTIGLDRPDHRGQLRAGRPPRRGGAAIRAGPRARPRAQRARGLPHDPAAAAEHERGPHDDPARRTRACG